MSRTLTQFIKYHECVTQTTTIFRDIRIGKNYDLVMGDGKRINGMFVNGYEPEEVVLVALAVNGDKQDPALIAPYEMMVRKGKTMIFGDSNAPATTIKAIEEPVRTKPTARTGDKPDRTAE